MKYFIIAGLAAGLLACAAQSAAKLPGAIPLGEALPPSQDFDADAEWVLSEFQTDGKITAIDRTAPSNKDVFTLKITRENEDGTQLLLSGRAAPNRYRAPASVGSDRRIVVQPVAGTLMAPLFEPEDLKESEFMRFISNIYSIEQKEERLIVKTKTGDGVEAALTFDKYQAEN